MRFPSLSGSCDEVEDTESRWRILIEGVVRQRDHASEASGRLRWNESPCLMITNRVDNANKSLLTRSVFFLLVSKSAAVSSSRYTTYLPRRFGSILRRL